MPANANDDGHFHVRSSDRELRVAVCVEAMGFSGQKLSSVCVSGQVKEDGGGGDEKFSGMNYHTITAE